MSYKEGKKMADRLISADALLERLIRKKAEPANKRYTEGFNDALMRFRSMVSTAPTIEPKHGRWIDTGSGQECSVCREIQYGYDNGRHYCPNCGARMDG